MEKLTIEEKAQRYDEAIEIAREINNEQRAQPFNVMTRVFPELKESKESEDEKIRKALLLDIPKVFPHDKAFKYIAWLEKQGENHIVGNNEMVKPIDKVEQKSAVLVPKFHVGDKLVSTYNTSLTYEVLEVGHINKLGNPDYKVEIFTDGKAENPRNIHYMECYKVDEWAKLIEQKPAWSEEDERMYRGLHNLIYSTPYCDSRKELSDWFKSLKDRVQPQPKQEWSKEDEEMIDAVIADIQFTQKAHNHEVNQIVYEREIDWLKSLKDRVIPQSKQEWSEEDEKCIRLSADIIDSALRAGFCVQLDRDRCVDWLKSLKPQNRWKPTKEQLETFDYYLDADISNKDKEILFGLYNDLKQL